MPSASTSSSEDGWRPRPGGCADGARDVTALTWNRNSAPFPEPDGASELEAAQAHRAGARIEVACLREWRESGVAMPDGLPARRGYGTELITRALPYQSQAETALEFTPDGVRCGIALPANASSSRTKEEPA